MVLPAKGFIADITGVGPLVGVRPLVNQQIVGLGEAPLAEATDELLLGAAADAIDARQLAAEVVGQVGVGRLEVGEEGLRAEVGREEGRTSGVVGQA